MEFEPKSKDGKINETLFKNVNTHLEHTDDQDLKIRKLESRTMAPQMVIETQDRDYDKMLKERNDAKSMADIWQDRASVDNDHFEKLEKDLNQCKYSCKKC